MKKADRKFSYVLHQAGEESKVVRLAFSKTTLAQLPPSRASQASSQSGENQIELIANLVKDLDNFASMYTIKMEVNDGV